MSTVITSVINANDALADNFDHNTETVQLLKPKLGIESEMVRRRNSLEFPIYKR